VIPLKKEDIDLLADETKVLIRANALGIPLICLVQGFFGAIGYWMFGVEDWLLWGFFTGVFAFFPLVGTMIVWVPLVAYMYATGTEWLATGLTVYSIVVTGNVDYLARMTLMKKLGNVHPLITVLGVIVGLNLFGFVGLIFGPLLISYFLILVKIYINEFTNLNASTRA
jgi:predicted PurR-regulated permease PerM